MVWFSHVNWDKLEVSSILLLGEVKLKWYNIDSEANLFSQISSAFINFSKNNESNKSIVDDGNYYIATNTFLENVSISILSSLFFCFQILILPKSLSIAESEQSVLFERLKQLTIKFKDYTQ